MTLTDQHSKLPYSDLNSLQPSDNNQKVDQLHGAKSKILKALLDLAILKEIDNRRVASVPFILKVLFKRHSVCISAGTIYPVFDKLEKTGYIERLPRKATKMYIITEKGRKILGSIRVNSNELNAYLYELVG